jgi:hypothetical protein
MEEITATLDETDLALYGPTTAGSAAYFRVSGPAIVIEYSPQAMGGDTTNQIHDIYRDPANDFGAEYTGITSNHEPTTQSPGAPVALVTGARIVHPAGHSARGAEDPWGQRWPIRSTSICM